jgi:hypothetical protein
LAAAQSEWNVENTTVRSIPRARRAGEIAAEVRLGVPRPGQAVAETGVAVAIDDHRATSRCKMRASARGAGTVLAGAVG